VNDQNKKSGVICGVMDGRFYIFSPSKQILVEINEAGAKLHNEFYDSSHPCKTKNNCKLMKQHCELCE
jgi:hypothetical protein